MTLLTMMLLPFLMSEHTSFLSSNAIAAMFNCAIKVCVIAFLAAAGSSALGGFFDSIKGDFASKGKSLLGIFIQLNMTVGFFLFMVLKIPKLVQGLLSGSPQMGASDAMGMARQGAHMAANVISGGATTALKAAGAYAAAGGGGLADAVGGGGGKMSSISNIGGGGSDATGMGAISGLSGGGGGGGAATMAANMGGGSGGGAASAPSGGGSMPSSGGGGATDVPADTGSKGDSGQSTFGRFKRAVATAGKNAVISAAQKNGLVQAAKQGYQIGSNPYGLSDAEKNAGGVCRSLLSNEVLNAAGNKIELNPNIEYPEIKPSSVVNPPPKLPQFDPNNFQV